MHCVILAGGQITEHDPLFEITKGDPKASIKLGGKSLINRVISAMREAKAVDDIAVIGLDRPGDLHADIPIDFLGFSIPNHFVIGDDECGNYWSIDTTTDTPGVWDYSHEVGEWTLELGS